MNRWTLKDNAISYLLCLRVADPATFLASNSVLGTLFSSENSLFIQEKSFYTSRQITLEKASSHFHYFQFAVALSSFTCLFVVWLRCSAADKRRLQREPGRSPWEERRRLDAPLNHRVSLMSCCAASKALLSCFQRIQCIPKTPREMRSGLACICFFRLIVMSRQGWLCVCVCPPLHQHFHRLISWGLCGCFFKNLTYKVF